MASYGDSLGVAFDDAAVDEFLVAYVDNKLTRKDVDAILREASNGQMSYFELREALKTNLSTMVVNRLVTSGLLEEGQTIASPGTLYNNFLKINRAASIQAYPVFANDYLEQVEGSPTEGEIEALFSVGRYAPPNPQSPDPAFAKSYRANIEYIEIDNQKLVEAEKAKLTEEELKAEYDRRVALGQLRVPVVQDVTPTTTPEERPPSPLTTKPGSDSDANLDATPESDSSEGSAATGTVEPTDQQPIDPPQETPEPVNPEEAATEEAPTEEPKTEEPKTEEPKTEATPEKADEKKKPEGGEQSANLGDVRFVSFVQEEAGQEGVSEKPAAESAANGEEPQVAEPNENTTGEASENTAEKPAEEGQANEGSSSVASPPVEAETGQDSPGTPAEPAMRTQTFEEARDSIADQLARERVRESSEVAIADLLNKEMNPYYEAKRQYDAFVESGLAEQTDEERVPPVKPDIKKLAEAAGLTWGETGMVDGFALAKLDVGRGVIDFQRNSTVVGTLMIPQTEKFMPVDALFFDQANLSSGLKRYIAWKVDDEDAYAPELSEVREEVVAAWKRIKARELAKAAAEEITKKVNAGDDPWSAALTDDQRELLVETSPFTWVSLSSGGFSTIPELGQDVGQAFMKQVFATEVGGTAVGPSANNEIFYAIRVDALTPSDDDLRTRFSNDKQKTASKGLASGEVQSLIGAWIGNLERELNFEWQEAAGQLGQ